MATLQRLQSLKHAAQKLADANIKRRVLRFTAAPAGAGVDSPPEDDATSFCASRQPSTVEEALSIQAFLSRRMSDMGVHVAGYKVGGPASDPFFGPLYTRDILVKPLQGPVRAANEYVVRGVEAEFAFELADDFAPLPEGREYTVADVLERTAFVFPAIEVCGSRLLVAPGVPPTAISIHTRIADQASHGSLIAAKHLRADAKAWAAYSAEVQARRTAAMQASTNWQPSDVELHIGTPPAPGAPAPTVVRGGPTNVMGDPAAAVAWLANALIARGAPHLRGGQVVTSGTMTGLTPVPQLAASAERLAAESAAALGAANGSIRPPAVTTGNSATGTRSTAPVSGAMGGPGVPVRVDFGKGWGTVKVVLAQ